MDSRKVASLLSGRMSRSPRPRRAGPRAVGGLLDWLLEDRCLPADLGVLATDPQVPQGSTVPLSQIFWNGGPPLNPAGIPNITAAPTLKTVTIQNTTSQTIYPIFRDANTGQDPQNTNPINPDNYYNPQDFHNEEYRAYIGYVKDNVQYLGLPGGAKITVRVPLVFWDAANVYIATDGTDLIPANPATDSNPFRYDPTSDRGVSLSTDADSWVTAFSGNAAASAGLVMFYHAKSPLTPSLDAPAQLTEFTIRDPYLSHWLTDDAQTSVLINYDVSYVDNLTSSIAMQATQVPVPIPDVANPPAADFGWAGSSLIYGSPQQDGTMQDLIADFINNRGNASIGQYFGGLGWPSYFNPNGVLKIPGGANIYANSPLNGQLSSYFTNGPNNQYMLSSGGTGPISASAGGVPLTDPHATQLPLSLTADQRPAFVRNLQDMLSGNQVVNFSISPNPTLLGRVTAYDARAGVIGIAVTNGGSGYDPNNPPTVTLTGGGGSGATAVAFVSAEGVLTGIGTTNSGSGYTSPPTVNISGNGGATAVASIGGGTATVVLNDGVSLPTGVGLSYVFTRPTTDYAASAMTNLWYSWAQYYVNQNFVPPTGVTGQIAANTNILTFTGSAPTTVAVGMSVSGPGINPAPGTKARVLDMTSNGITSIAVTNGGSGYKPGALPTVNIIGGGGTGASAVAVVSAAGVITGVTVVNAGSGYTSPPTISFSDVVGGGTGATATATVGPVVYLSQLSQGGGSGAYTFARPDMLPFANPDGIKSIVVTAGGNGYKEDAPPTVVFTGGGGSGASATAIVSKTGQITGIALISAGSGYTSPPTISFTNTGGGTGATATADVGTFVTTFPLTFTKDQQKFARKFAGSVYAAMAAEADIITYPTKSPLLPPSMSLVYTVIGCDTADLPNANGGASLVGAQVRDLIKSILRGVDDFTQYPESQWYPNPATWQGGQKFNVYNLDPYVWFVHQVLGLSGYGFSVDDDTSDVSAAASNYTPVNQRVLPNNLSMVFSGLGDLTNTKQWFGSVNYGTVTDTGTISNPTSGPNKGKTIVTLQTTTKYWQIANPGPALVGAFVTGPGIPPGTVVAAQGDVNARILILSNRAPNATNVTLKFTGDPPPNPILNAGFEQPRLTQPPPGNFITNPSGGQWTFNSGSGIAGNGSSLTALNGPAPVGSQVAFLQGAGEIIQTVTLQAGTYNLSFFAAQRQRGQSVDVQTIAVLVDGKLVGKVTPSGANYTAYTVTFTVTAGTHTIEIEGTGSKESTMTAFIDGVNLTATQPAKLTKKRRRS